MSRNVSNDISIPENFKVFHVQGDGNCLFRSVSQFIHKDVNLHQEIRVKSVEYIVQNWEDFKDFQNYEDIPISKDEYSSRMLTPGTYGTYFECMAISEVYKINVFVYVTHKRISSNKIFYNEDKPINISKNYHRDSIFLNFSGNLNCGHYDLLIPLDENFCKSCNKIFKSKKGANTHLQKYHKEEFSNSVLPENISDISLLNDTKCSKTLQGKEKINCNLCGHFFKGHKGLKQHLTMKHKEMKDQLYDSDPLDIKSINNYLYTLKAQIPVIKRIPKGARISVAEELNILLEKCVKENSPRSWVNLFIFPYAVLKVPDKSRKNRSLTLTSIIKSNLTEWKNNKILNFKVFFEFYKPSQKINNKKVFSSKSKTEVLQSKVQGKIAENDIKGAIRLLCSEDSLAENNNETLKKLQDKHQEDIENQSFPDPDILDYNQQMSVSIFEIKKAIGSFRPGSAGGLDSLRPQHLKDLISDDLGTFSQNLLFSLTSLTKNILLGHVEKSICPIFYGASLCALGKKNGDIRPIAVGMCIRRLAAKVVCAKINDSLGTLLRPKQLGFGTKSGSEIVVHTIRNYLSLFDNSEKVILKIDFFNAFNMVSRSTILFKIKEFAPEYYNFIYQCYREPSYLTFNGNIILSQRGVQQGDPLGPPLFCLAINSIIRSLKSEINLWYLDDGTLAGDPCTVFEDFQNIINYSSKIGLNINFSKCELSFLNGNSDMILSSFQNLNSEFYKVSIIDKNSLILLGCPFYDQEISKVIRTKIETFKKLTINLSFIDSHIAYFLLRHSFSVPRITYLLRCAPCWRALDDLQAFDNIVKSCLENIINCKLNDKAYLQSILAVKMGGLGVRNTSTLCFSAFLGSVNYVLEYINLIFPNHLVSSDKIFDEAQSLFLKLLGDENKFQNNSNMTQKIYDKILCDVFYKNVKQNSNSLYDEARILALQHPESNAWLQALPSVSLGNLLDNSSFRISMALRLGQPVCEEHTCTCGEKVDILGLHGLSCFKSAGRALRHGLLNDVIKRALSSVGIPSVLEPSGISRSDGKRVDGLSLVPWKAGRALIWDATCRDTMASSYLEKTSKKGGEAARSGELQKINKYSDLVNRYYFVPFSVETFGTWGNEAKKFIFEITKKQKNKQMLGFITQKISLAIQRGNALSVIATLPAGPDLDDFYFC